MDIKIPGKLFGVDGKKALERILAEKDDESKPETTTSSSVIVAGKYDIIRNLIYGGAMGVLRQDYAAGRIPNHPTIQMPGGVKMTRALTMKETAQARLNNYETLKDIKGNPRSEEDRLALFKTWSFTGSGIAYQKNSTKYKIIPISEHLISIEESHNKAAIPIEYTNINGAEIDTRKGKYNQGLALNEVLETAGWIESFEGDKKTLTDYANLVFKLLKNPEKAMGFYVLSTPDNELRALALLSLHLNSDANGSSLLHSSACFVRVNPSL